MFYNKQITLFLIILMSKNIFQKLKFKIVPLYRKMFYQNRLKLDDKTWVKYF